MRVPLKERRVIIVYVDKGINNPYEFSFGDQYYSNIVGRDEYSHFGRGLDIDFEGT